MLDAIARRRYGKYFNMILFPLFRRPMKYRVPSNDANDKQYDDLGRLEGNPNWDDGTFIKSNDPIIPLTDRATSRLLEGLAEINHAELNQYSRLWLSHKVVPEKTTVYVDGKFFKSDTVADYKHIFGFNMYGLKGRDDTNGLSKPDVSEPSNNGSGSSTSGTNYFTDD